MGLCGTGLRVKRLWVGGMSKGEVRWQYLDAMCEVEGRLQPCASMQVCSREFVVA